MLNIQLKCPGCGAMVFCMEGSCPNCGKSLDEVTFKIEVNASPQTEERGEVPEDEKRVCYYCGIPYDHRYDECTCGCASMPISISELIKERGSLKSQLSEAIKERDTYKKILDEYGKV